MKWFGQKKPKNVTVDWDNNLEVHSHGPTPVVLSFDQEAEKEYEASWAATAEEMKGVKGGFRNRNVALEAYNRELAEVGCCPGEAVMDSFKPPSCAQDFNESCEEDGAPSILEDPNYAHHERSNSSTASAVSIEDARGMHSIRDGKDINQKFQQENRQKGWFDTEDDEKASRFYRKVALTSCLCVLIAAFIILLVALVNKNNPTDTSELNLGNANLLPENGNQSTGAGSNNAGLGGGIYQGTTECDGKAAFLVYTTCDSFNNEGSPQYKAWNWLRNADKAELTLEEGSTEFEIQQRFAAATLFFSTAGDEWMSGLGFLSGGSICTWNDGEKGIFCADSESGVATEINIVDNNLIGNIPVEVNYFSQLKTFNLYYGKLSGYIPSLEALVKLEQIDFDGNELSGDVPESIFNLPNLRNLFLLNNKGLTGAIPDIRGDSKMENLSLYECSLSGPLPTSLGSVSTLQLLQLKDNDFTGTIPVSLFELSELHTLGLHGNRLGGTVPDFPTGSGAKLQTLSLGNNLFEGPLPSGMGGLTSLKFLFVQGNSLTGSVGDGIMSLPLLEQLWLHSNGFSGELPNVGLLPATIKDLFLDNNLFSGSLDDLLANAPASLEQIDVSGNSGLRGTISDDMARFTSLVAFNASFCELWGGLRGDTLSQLTSLQSFAVAGNFMTESIPSRIDRMTNLGILDLSKNDFSGTIPPELGSLEFLSYLDLSGNPSLTGDLDPIVCNKDIPLSSAVADCSDGNPVQCSCCICV